MNDLRFASVCESRGLVSVGAIRRPLPILALYGVTSPLLSIAVLVCCAADTPRGELGRACYPNSTCNAPLVCVSAFCVDPDAVPAQGVEGSRCYPNATCNQGLSCLSGLCVRVSSEDAGTVGPASDAGMPLSDAGFAPDAGMAPDAGPTDAGTLPIFLGTCLEPLYRCFNPSGRGVCSYDSRIRVASLTFPGGDKVTSDAMGSGQNWCFSPEGPLCMTVSRLDGGGSRFVSGLDRETRQLIEATVEDGVPGTLVVRCHTSGTYSVPQPSSNPSFADLRTCVPR